MSYCKEHDWSGDCAYCKINDLEQELSTLRSENERLIENCDLLSKLVQSHQTYTPKEAIK